MQLPSRYVSAELRRLGLDVRLEEVQVPHWVRGEERAELVSYPGQAATAAQKLVVTALGGSVATPPGGITGEVVAVPDFEALERLGRDRVAGRIVVFNQPFDERMVQAGYAEEAYGEAVAYRSRGPIAAARLGAVACLVRSAGGAVYRLPHTGGTDVPEGRSPNPGGCAERRGRGAGRAASTAGRCAHASGPDAPDAARRRQLQRDR